MYFRSIYKDKRWNDNNIAHNYILFRNPRAVYRQFASTWSRWDVGGKSEIKSSEIEKLVTT